MQNIIKPTFNDTQMHEQDVKQEINNILQQKLPQEFLEGVQKIIVGKSRPEEKKNKLTSFLCYCDSFILSTILASIIVEYYKFLLEQRS